jgi:hypothetical protein
MWNPFKKSNNNQGDESKSGGFAANMMMRIAQKKLEKMGPKERENMMKEAFNPKNRDKLLSAMEMMKKSGQITEEQYEEAKKRLGM